MYANKEGKPNKGRDKEEKTDNRKDIEDKIGKIFEIEIIENNIRKNMKKTLNIVVNDVDDLLNIIKVNDINDLADIKDIISKNEILNIIDVSDIIKMDNTNNIDTAEFFRRNFTENKFFKYLAPFWKKIKELLSYYIS